MGKLEFLGDAVMGLVVTSYIFYCLGADTRKGLKPGQLSDLRSSIVKNDCLAFMSAVRGLDKCLMHGSPALHEMIQAFRAVRCSTACHFWQNFVGPAFCCRRLDWTAYHCCSPYRLAWPQSAGAVRASLSFRNTAAWIDGLRLGPAGRLEPASAPPTPASLQLYLWAGQSQRRCIMCLPSKLSC